MERELRTATRLLALVLAASALAATGHGAGALRLTTPVDGSHERAPSFERIDLEVDDGFARTHLRQKFTNSTSDRLDATYECVLPPAAVVTGFATWEGTRRVPGVLMDSAEARSVPAVGRLEASVWGEFRMALPALAAGETRRVELTFDELLAPEAGVVTWRLPVAAAGPGRRFRAVIRDSASLDAIWSPSHAVRIFMGDVRTAHVTFEVPAADPAPEIVLCYRPGAPAKGPALLAHREGEDPGYFCLTGPPEPAGTPDPPVDLYLMVDLSTSMGPALDAVKLGMAAALDQLDPRDRFNLVGFATESQRYREAPVTATPDELERARRWIQGLRSKGASDHGAALSATLSRHSPAAGRPARVIMITNGLPTLGTIDADQAAASLPGVPIITLLLGTGDDGSARFFAGLARATGGELRLVGAAADPARALIEAVRRHREPASAPPAIDWTGAAVTDVHVLPGRPWRVIGRFSAAGVTEITPGPGAAPVSLTFPLRSLSHAYLARFWAEAAARKLLGTGETAEVVRLSLEHQFVTPLTSFVSPDREGDRSIENHAKAAKEEARGKDAPALRRNEAAQAQPVASQPSPDARRQGVDLSSALFEEAERDAQSGDAGLLDDPGAPAEVPESRTGANAAPPEGDSLALDDAGSFDKAPVTPAKPAPEKLARKFEPMQEGSTASAGPAGRPAGVLGNEENLDLGDVEDSAILDTRGSENLFSGEADGFAGGAPAAPAAPATEAGLADRQEEVGSPGAVAPAATSASDPAPAPVVAPPMEAESLSEAPADARPQEPGPRDGGAARGSRAVAGPPAPAVPSGQVPPRGDSSVTEITSGRSAGGYGSGKADMSSVTEVKTREAKKSVHSGNKAPSSSFAATRVIPPPVPSREIVVEPADDMALDWVRRRRELDELRSEVRRMTNRLARLEAALGGPVAAPPFTLEEVHVSPEVVETGDQVLVELSLRVAGETAPRLRWRARDGRVVESRQAACLWEAPAAPGVYTLEVLAAGPAQDQVLRESIEIEVHQPARVTYSPGVISERAWLLEDAMRLIRQEAAALEKRLGDLRPKLTGLAPDHPAWKAVSVPRLELAREGSILEAALSGAGGGEPPRWDLTRGTMKATTLEPSRIKGTIQLEAGGAVLVTAEWSDPAGSRWILSRGHVPGVTPALQVR